MENREAPQAYTIKESKQRMQFLSNNEKTMVSTTSAIAWSYIGSFSSFFLRFGLNILLARLLGPEAFGTMAILITVLGLGMLFGEMGINTALIQQQKITNDDVLTVFWINIFVGVLLALIIYFSSGWVARTFNAADAKKVVETASPIFIVQFFGLTPRAMLIRAMNFRWLKISEILSYIMGYGACGITCALLGWGIWSLVIAYGITQVFTATLFFYKAQIRIKFSFPYTKVPRLIGFSLNVLAINLVNYTAANVDRLVINRVLGESNLGLYSRAQFLSNNMTHLCQDGLQQVMFPALSRMQDDKKRIKKNYMRSLGVLSILVFPLSWSLAAVSNTVFIGLYGTIWRDGVPVLFLFAILAPFMALTSISGPICLAVNKPGMELRRQIIYLIFVITGLCFGFEYGLSGMTMALVTAGFVRFIILTSAGMKISGARFPAVLKVILPGIWLGLLVAGVIYLENCFIQQYVTTGIMRLTILAICGLVSFALIFHLIGLRLLKEHLAPVWQQTRTTLPKIIRVYLDKKWQPCSGTMMP